MTILDDVELWNLLHQEMARVDGLRVRLNPNSPSQVWLEFWMRRALLRARFAMTQRNLPEAKRMWKVLAQIGHGNT
jgi:hypothetical protein